VVRDGVGFADGTVFYLGDTFVRDLAITLLTSAIIIAILQLRRLHHASELWKLITGRYYYPREVELAFLFVDLVGSTPTAERLGHLGFSRLLRDLFADLSEPILAWRGRVYQHLGDGVIVSWTTQALESGAAVHCYFDMVDHLEVHRAHYQQQYGVAPQIRGSVHAGPVVATWVGEAKKELAYHGDTLNAAARMLSACKPLGVPLLVSEGVVAGVSRSEGLGIRSVGEVPLEGREDPLLLFTVERRAPAP
jgi:adenylate cyclase